MKAMNTLSGSRVESLSLSSWVKLALPRLVRLLHVRVELVKVEVAVSVGGGGVKLGGVFQIVVAQAQNNQVSS